MKEWRRTGLVSLITMNERFQHHLYGKLFFQSPIISNISVYNFDLIKRISVVTVCRIHPFLDRFHLFERIVHFKSDYPQMQIVTYSLTWRVCQTYYVTRHEEIRLSRY